MCELFAMSSRLPAAVNFSLDAFSRHGGLGGPNRDGWGIAYFDDGNVRLIKEPEPAANSDWVRFIENHGLRSTFVISHIRHATQGDVTLKNTQPYTRELGGRRHVFVHNGDLGDIVASREFRLEHFSPVGDTESEHAFCLLLERLRHLWLPGRGIPPLSDRLAVVDEFAAAMRELGPMNFIFADGDTLFVHGHVRRHDGSGEITPPGLQILRKESPGDARGAMDSMHAEGLAVRPDPEEQQVVLVASVPLNPEAWTPLPEGHVLALREGALVARSPGLRVFA